MQHQALTEELFLDIIDKHFDAIGLCERHGISLPQLTEIMQDEQFKHTLDRLNAVEQRRLELTKPLRRFEALRMLEKIMTQEPTGPTHAETIRRAATFILTGRDPLEFFDEPEQHTYEPQPTPETQTQAQQAKQPDTSTQSKNTKRQPYSNEAARATFPIDSAHAVDTKSDSPNPSIERVHCADADAQNAQSEMLRATHNIDQPTYRQSKSPQDQHARSENDQQFSREKTRPIRGDP